MESTQTANPALMKLKRPYHGPAGGVAFQKVPIQKNTNAKTRRIVPIMVNLRKPQMQKLNRMAINIRSIVIPERFIPRFFERVKKTDNCWRWNGFICRNGYGQFTVENNKYLAHRVSYFLHKGKIADGLTIDHLCRNRACVNPDHLECVPLKVNILRGNNQAALNSKKTICKRGHLLEGNNLRKYRSSHSRLYRSRECRECNILAKRKFINYRKQNKLCIQCGEPSALTIRCTSCLLKISITRRSRAK